MDMGVKAICLRVVSDQGIEASITCDGSHGGAGDYYSVVSVKGFIIEKNIYGIDPIQSFTLGWALIERLTTDRRVEDEAPEHAVGKSWRIQSFSI
jgi:hypothetical protein